MIAGQRAGHNFYTLDGVSITDQYFNNLVISPSIDALQEFKIEKSIYSAEFGGKASANVNAVTKAGTNKVHGSLLEFVRNDIFDTRNYFDPPDKPKPPLRLNQFGGSIGGPIARNRVFFFSNYEGSLERRGLTRTFSLPSSNVRGGVLLLHSLLNSTGGDPAMAAAGYYQGLSSVQRYGMFNDTKAYVRSVLALRNRF